MISLPSTQSVVYIVEERANPSTDFFVLPAVFIQQKKFIRCDFDNIPSVTELTGATILFVRYIPSTWLKLISSIRNLIHKIIFFMDDDVLDINASKSMPWRYRLKLARLASCRYVWLRQQKAELWVSTPYLQQKYADWPATLLLPSPLNYTSQVCRVFYHGSASHEADIQWLKPIIATVLQSNEQVVFEIIGGQSVYKLYKNLPRTTIVHPMQWSSYQSFLTMQPRHIGLNPLLNTAFNKARSYTKFFDITRSGATGIFSSNSACAEIVDHEKDGLVLDLDQEIWANAIIKLAKNEAHRQLLLTNAETKLKILSERAQKNHLELTF